MTESLVLDVLLVLALLGAVSVGFRAGFTGSAIALVGIVAGVVAALFLSPIVASWVPVPFLRIGVTVGVALLLVLAGFGIGRAIGRGIRRGIGKSPLSGIDRVLGALAAGVVAALVASTMSFSVGQLGVPVLSRSIAGSVVLRTIGTLTPDPVEAFLAQLRGAVVDQGIPLIADALGGGTPAIPQIDTGSPALNTAAQSVVRITGNAYACGQSQSGTGFVVAPDRVVTNAHVVAGVTEPVIDALDGQALSASVVYFDPIDDLAVLAVPGLDAPVLPLASTLAPGTDAAFEGYPYGGPFSSSPAAVVSVGPAQIKDIYGETGSSRDTYTLAATVREGNSGGPLLTLDGQVAGVVFARSADNPDVGYAMTMTELDPVAAQAGALDAAVSSGDCIRD